MQEEVGFQVSIKVPTIQGLGDSKLELLLNENYLDEGFELYKSLQDEMDVNKIIHSKYLALFSDYDIKVNNDQLLVVKRVTTEVQASGAESVTYDTIDKVNKIVVTLPSLFKNDAYVEHISAHIKQQMQQQMQQDPSRVYFVNNGQIQDSGFQKIRKDQNFYINDERKLVISFDEYEVAPGNMGSVEFVIPTSIIRNDLVNNDYVY